MGVPRTIRLGWSFPHGTDPIEAVAELADVALWLLGADPASVYALADDDRDPPFVHVNLLAANGGLAMLESTVGTPGVPARRELHLLASEGEIVHRTGHDDLLWSDDGAEVFHATTDRDDPSSSYESDQIGHRTLAIRRAIAASLAEREPVLVTKESTQ